MPVPSAPPALDVAASPGALPLPPSAPSPRPSRKITPSTRNSAPAALLTQTAGTALLTASPAITAIADVATSATADPANTTHLDDPPAASDSVASCVLSPISARKIAANVDAKSFQSIPEHTPPPVHSGGPTP